MKCVNVVREVNFWTEDSSHEHVAKLRTFAEEDYECCGVCRKLLLGLIDQGYLCEECQLHVHLSCVQRYRSSLIA